jgi:hypothetical protein
MATATCFRCDWKGDADGDACPNCGAPLYRRPPPVPGTPHPSPPVTPPGRPAGPPRPEFLPLAAPEEGPASRPPRRSHAFVAFVLLAVIVTGSLWWFLRAHEVPPGAQAVSPPPDGHLVYAASGEGGERLWDWDPRTGTATEGPQIGGEVVQLVSAQGALSGWLGVTTRTAGGRLDASILRTQTPDARPAHVLTGDLVAWGPNGATVVAADLGAQTNGCYASLAVDRERLDRGPYERVFRRSRFCGGIRMLGQTLATTYLTWERPDGTGVFFLGNGDLHVTLRGWSMLSVSPTSDLLVQPAPPTAESAGGAALFWRGAEQPDPYHSGGVSPVVVSEVLTWTTGADGALVIATIEGVRGLYLLDTTPGGSRAPLYIGPATTPAFATAAFDGSLYVAMQSRLLVYRAGGLTEIDLPEGAPHPAGPIAWMPG